MAIDEVKALKDREVDRKTRKSRHSWYLYDFGNSAYASIVLLAVYSAYFKDGVVGGPEGTRLWGLSVGLSAIIVAIISPILGTIADFTKSKKKLLFVFTIMSVSFTALLFFVRKGDIFIGILFFVLAEIGYRAAQVFYDALLTDVSTPESIGFVSGKGWAVGMLGGIAALLIVLLPIQLVGNAFIPYAFPITAAIYLVFSIPTFTNVREKREKEKIPEGKSVIGLAFGKLAETFRSIKSYKEFIKYTAAFLIYNDGIMMLMDFAAIIGATLYGMKQIDLIIFVILIHVSGTFGALLFGRISDKKSSKEAIILSILILVSSISCLYFIDKITWFYVIGLFAGFSLSGAQAVSRTMVSQLAPFDKVSEFYGFLSVAGRTSTFVGPLVFSTLSFRMSNWYVNHGVDALRAEKNGLLWGIGSIIFFLIIGLLLLLLVKRVTVKEPVKY